MDDTDRRLLIFLQHEIPLRAQPFAAIGERLGMDGAEVLLRINRLKRNQAIRRISGVFDSKKFGYKRLTAAFHFEPAALQPAAQAIAENASVVSCTERNHFWNLWVTAAVPGWESAEAVLRRIEKQYGSPMQLFQDLQIFKSGGQLQPLTEAISHPLSALEMQVIAGLQEDLPLTDRPFERVAERLWITEAKLFETLHRLRERKILHRVSVSFSRKTQAPDELLVIWQVPEEKQAEAGFKFAYFDEVIFCARRASGPDFPYSLHTLFQSRRKTMLEAVLKQIEEQVGRGPKLELWTVKEYKKSRFIYFAEDTNLKFETRKPKFETNSNL